MPKEEGQKRQKKKSVTHQSVTDFFSHSYTVSVRLDRIRAIDELHCVAAVLVVT